MKTHIKNIYAYQRDQSFLKVALDDLKARKNMLQAQTESTKESNCSTEKVAESVTSVRKPIGDGLGLLASAFANKNQSVPTQTLANTYYQPENLQRNSSL